MTELKCSRCGTIMEDYGVQKIRIGGVGGGWSYAIGDIAEIEQDILPVHVHICPKCEKMELSATERAGAMLLSRSGLKKCVSCGKRIPLAAEECQHCGAKQAQETDKL